MHTRNIVNIIEECAATTKSKGFSTDQHATQIVLIATEVAEALECIELEQFPTSTAEAATNIFVRSLIWESSRYESIRKATLSHNDPSIVADQKHLNEELADICIRVFSYVGGNGQTKQFIDALIAKMEKNRNRPHKHGKGF